MYQKFESGQFNTEGEAEIRSGQSINNNNGNSDQKKKGCC